MEGERERDGLALEPLASGTLSVHFVAQNAFAAKKWHFAHCLSRLEATVSVDSAKCQTPAAIWWQVG